MSNVGEQRVCRVNDWRRATLDGLVKATGSVFEAKDTSAFAKPDEVLERYMPQLQHNMAVTGHQQAVLSVIFGDHKFEIFNVAADWLYQIEPLEAEKQFGNVSGLAKSRSSSIFRQRPDQSASERFALKVVMRGHLPPSTG